MGISLGMYQGFLTVTIFLVILVSMLSLADGANWMRVFGKGLCAIAMIVLGIGLNQIIVQIGLKITDVTMTEWNNNVGYLKNLSPWLLPQLLKNTYLGWYGSILSVASMYPNLLVSTLSKVLMAVFAFGIIAVLIDKKLGRMERLLFGVLAGLLPLGMNFFAMVAPEGNHDLTKYAIWLFYLTVLLFADRLGAKIAVRFPKVSTKAQWPKYICYAIILLLLYSNANFANGMYLRKDYEYDAYFALMTKVSDRMDRMEDYVPGETPVVFVGVPLNDGTYMSPVLPGFERYTPVTGMWSSDVIMAEMPERFQAYFETILGLRIRCAQPTQWREILQDSRTEAIPSYPDQGCVAFVGDVLVVKLSEKYSTGVSFWRHPSVYSE